MPGARKAQGNPRCCTMAGTSTAASAAPAGTPLCRMENSRLRCFSGAPWLRSTNWPAWMPP
jgi:hypothetical protein